MKKILVILMLLIQSAMPLSGCKFQDNSSIDNFSDSNIPNESTVLTPISDPVRISTLTPVPTSPLDTLELSGYTPLGINIMKSIDKKDTSDYIMLNTKKGWKVSYKPQGMFRVDITLYKTTSGGKVWTKVTSSFDKKHSIPSASQSGIIFNDNLQGWLTTQTPQTGYIGLYRTLDGGTTWNLQPIEVPKEYSDIEFGTYPPVFFTKNDAILLTSSYFAKTDNESKEQLVYVTHDGGNTWKQMKEKEDSIFQWSFATESSKNANKAWTIIYNGIIWNSTNLITWDFKQTTNKEVGIVPTWVKWNNKIFTVTGKTVHPIGKKLGVSEDSSLTGVPRNIYSIPNVDSDKEIAIQQLNNTYFKAVFNK